MTGGGEERYCPICEERMYETSCPKDGVQTIPYSVLKSSTAQLKAGTIIDERYRIDSALGSGAMGTVYSATQTRMDRRVALKILVRELLRDGKELKRFYREAKSASRIKHPNVVRVYDFGVDDATQMPFLAMELVEGQTLRRLLAEEGPLPLQRTADILEQVSKALVAAHELGIVHRDLKPDNMMVGRLPGGDEHVTVLDFGIAKATKTPGGLQESLTASGVVVGTPRYMSPEQVKGNEVDHRSDLYALGCILHEMLTGEAPFTADEPVALMLRHVNAVRPPLPRVTDDEELQEAMSKLHRALLHAEPEQRPVSAARLAAMMRRVARRQPLGGVEALLHAPSDTGAGGHFGEDSIDFPSGPKSESNDAVTDTHVKSRLVPTPADSRAFSSLGIESQTGAHNQASPLGLPGRRRKLLALIPLVVLGVGATIWATQTGEQPLKTPAGTREPTADPVQQSATDAPSSANPPQDGVEGSVPTTSSMEAASNGVESAAEEPATEASAEVVKPPPNPTAAEPARTVEIKLRGSPRGAVVTDATGRRVCRLPCNIEVARSRKAVRYTVYAPNHYRRSLRVTPLRDRRISVKLLPKLADPTY